MKQSILFAAVSAVFAASADAGAVPTFTTFDRYATAARGSNWTRAAADFTRDGRADLVLTRNYALPGVITVLPGDGVGGFGTPITTPLPTIPKLVTVGTSTRTASSTSWVLRTRGRRT